LTRKVLMVDIEKCTGCRICEIACSLHNAKVCNPSKSRIHVLKWDRYGISIPLLCQQCETPLCEKVCPTKATYRDTKTKALLVNHDLCIGCRQCVMICPFGGSSWDAEEGIILRCDLCKGDPVCVKLCPTGALEYVTITKYILLRKRESAGKISELVRRLVLAEG